MQQESELAKAANKSKINWDRLDTPIQHEGRSITLPGVPGKMPIEKAIEALNRKLHDENTQMNVHEIIDAYPLDAAVAFVKAMTNLYGWASPVATPGFFGPRPPAMISVKTGHRDEDVVQCPIGAFVLPGVEGRIQVEFTEHPKGLGQVLVMCGTFKKRDKHLILELANETRRIVKEQSVYKGKAIRIGVDEYGNMDFDNPPDFMDVSDIQESDLIFSDEIASQINVNILVPMKQTARCRKLKIPLKRGVLLEGKYGTGKSLTARLAAKVAEDNGWTFILLDKVQGLRVALEFANRYSPAIVFAEDIDRIATERDEKANDLINVIDGVVSKRSEVMTILTTNFVEKLNPVILRPGRLDAVISLKAPDQDAVKKLIRFYAGNLIPKDADLTASAKELEGQIPASIRECVERAKLGMVGRDDTKLSDLDITVAAQTMKNHLALLNKDEDKPSKGDVLANALQAVVVNGSAEKMEVVYNKVRDIHNQVC